MSLFDITPHEDATDRRRPARRPHASRPAGRPRRPGAHPRAGQAPAPADRARRTHLGDPLGARPEWHKTTRSPRLIARLTHCEFIPFSAVLSGIKEIKAVMADAERLRRTGRRTILFVDEIPPLQQGPAGRFPALCGARRHRADRRHHREPVLRSDFGPALALPGLRPAPLDRAGDRHPAPPRAGRSRTRPWRPRTPHGPPTTFWRQIATFANGDARSAYNTLEAAASASDGGVLSPQAVADALQRKVLLYDKSGEEHFNLISALHKSVRSSDPRRGPLLAGPHAGRGRGTACTSPAASCACPSRTSAWPTPRALEQAIAMMQAVHFPGHPRRRPGAGAGRHLPLGRAQNPTPATEPWARSPKMCAEPSLNRCPSTCAMLPPPP